MLNRGKLWLAGCVSVLGLAIGSANAGVIDFEELPGDESPIAANYQPAGLPAGVTTGFTEGFLGSFAGEPGADGGLYIFIELGAGAISFAGGPVEIPSIYLATDYADDSSVIGLLGGNPVWTINIAGGTSWTEFTDGAGLEIDELQFSGQYLSADLITVNGAVIPEPASLGLLALGGLALIRRR